MAVVKPGDMTGMDKVWEGANALNAEANPCRQIPNAEAGPQAAWPDVKASEERSPTISPPFVLVFLGKTMTFIGCCVVSVFPDETMTFIGGADWRVPKDSPGLTERVLWFSLGFMWFLQGLMFLRWQYVLTHMSVNELLVQLDLSDEVGPYTAISKNRRLKICKARHQRKRVIIVNFTTQLMIIPIALLFIDGSEKTPQDWMVPVFVFLIVFDLCHFGVMDPLDEIMEALSQRASAIALKLQKGMSVDWAVTIAEYQELDSQLEELSSNSELGSILLLRVGVRIVLMGIGLFTMVAVGGDFSADNTKHSFAFGAATFVLAAAILLKDLAQFAEIEAQVNCRHFKANSIVGRANNLVGATGMSDRDRIDQLMFLNYTKENRIAIALCGVIIDQPLIASVGKQLLLNIPVLIAAINVVVAKTA